MKQLKQKLCSNAGASMIVAMVFMIFCVFIGGAVLAASTANGGRVADRSLEQQEQLDQHSAASVLAELLSGSDEAPMQLVIEKIEVKTEGEKDSSISYRFSLPVTEEPKPALQRIVYEYAMDQYLAGEMGADRLLPGTIEVSSAFNFAGQQPPGYSYFFSPPPEDAEPSREVFVEISDPFSHPIQATLIFEPGLFSDLNVGFNGNSEQVQVFVQCLQSEAQEPQVVVRGNTKTTTTTQIVCWADPVILKGGVSDE